MVAVSNCAFPEQSQFQVLSHLFKRMARNRKAGRVIVELRKLTEETKEKLEKSLIPHDAYVKGWNASINNDWNGLNEAGK